MALSPLLSPSFVSPFFPKSVQPRLNHHLQWSFGRIIPARRNFNLPCCSTDGSSKKKKKKRPSRAAKSDQELCDELLEFVSVMGFSGDRVPSLKELRDNGRKDLANILRRRGYKAISELLRLSNERDSHSGKNLVGHEDPTNTKANESAEDQGTIIDVSPKSISSGDLVLEEKTMGHSNGALIVSHPAKASETSESTVVSSHFEPENFIQSVQLAKEGEDNDPPLHLASKGQELNNQTEIDRLKFLLHQKEIELSQMKQQIENEKVALFNLKAKAKAEIGKVQRFIAEKDVELHAVEENLNGLKEVHVDYFAHGQIVEVAGTFNGWQHRVRMNLHQPSAPHNPPGARNQLPWTTVLWLYPGVYEIKFIVDGHWRIDPQREVVTTDGITNNVLRVE